MSKQTSKHTCTSMHDAGLLQTANKLLAPSLSALVGVWQSAQIHACIRCPFMGAFEETLI